MSMKIGTAGWSIPRESAEHFPSVGAALERYSVVFDVAEINSSFHRSHRHSTWERWRESVPDSFRFSVKVPKEVTHQRKLVGYSETIDRFLDEAGILGPKLAVLLVQLPPKLAFDAKIAASFFADLETRTSAMIACEPRHPSWFTEAADETLARSKVARVAADPSICPEAAVPGGWRGLCYTRLHGSPVIYRSSYEGQIDTYAERLTAQSNESSEVWCIFDNTASSAAIGDALALKRAVKSKVAEV
jgi:uncharacterized protein YecE (DUF72 family)